MSIRSTAVIAAVVLTAVIGLSAAPASAAGTVSYSALIPVSVAYEIEPVIITGKCDIADSAAHMTDAYPVQWPEVPAAQGIDSATTSVLIDLDSRGTLVNAAVADSSGNALLDDEALLAARLSRYAPEVQRCNRFARSYLFNVMFE